MNDDQALTAIAERVLTLEHWRIQLDIAQARAEEQRKHLDLRFDALDKKIGSVNDTLTWATRIVIGAVILAVITFAMRGGFHI
jgi:hypothetical protein